MHDILIDVSNGGHIINIAHRHLHQSTQTRLRFIKQLREERRVRTAIEELDKPCQ
jgi:hypothetical protein